jgi:uncharacterized protein YcbK (DUF882 family)
MPIRHLTRIMALVLGFAGPALLFPSISDAASVGGKAHVKRQGKAHVKKKVVRGKARGKKKARGRFVGHAVAASQLRSDPLPRPSGRVVVRSVSLRETADVTIYNDDGSYNQAALATLDRVFRCRRTHEERAMDPRLYEILSLLYDRYGKTVEVNSGFRYQRNEGSRHFHGSAMDVHVPGVSYRELYAFANSLDGGGMGIGRYPRSSFVHIDYRAPGEPSYRWTDTQRTRRDPGKAPSKMWRRSSRPNS